VVFSSESFLFLFLPVFLVVYYLTPLRFRSYPILAGSYLFYAWWRVDFLGLLFLTTCFAYVVGQQIAKHRGTSLGKTFLVIGAVGCLGVLGVFKYLNFFIDSFATLLGTDPAGLGIHWHLILPIGISFYIFQALSYLIDVYRGDATADAKFVDFAAFIALFPQLIAGPILRYKDLEDQFREREHSVELFCDGLMRFLIGLGKKVILADAVAPLADLAFATENPGMALAWAGAAAYTLQLYFDFSGYSDMAIGLGKMMGFRFLENFRFPYISLSITEFWRRWHISLSNWLRDYLYISLGGNRKGVARTYANLILVMVLGGLWHGANWTFVLWGLWHGGLLAAERFVGWDRTAKTYWYALPLTLTFVLIGWVMFRATHVGEAFEVYGGMIGMNGLIGDPAVWASVTRESLALALLAAFVVYLEPRIDVYFAAHNQSGGVQLAATMAVLVIGAVTILKLAEQSFSPFLYFQF
jgi:alginate O-acetyltransferase complex protein AlgI